MNEPGQTLFFDADDTLWENSVYFERAITSFISYLDHKVHTAEEVREHLNAIEIQTIRAFGYGLKSFRRSLTQCFEDLTSAPLTEEKRQRIADFVDSIADREVKLLPMVSHTMPQLALRHRLFLVTKGDKVEQTDKLLRSGLAAHFAGVEVLSEKHELAYRELTERHKCQPVSTWMIGNSPKSDINSALAAGLNAVFLPHTFTWILEHEVVSPPLTGRTLVELDSFSQLLEHF